MKWDIILSLSLSPSPSLYLPFATTWVSIPALAGVASLLWLLCPKERWFGWIGKFMLTSFSPQSIHKSLSLFLSLSLSLYVVPSHRSSILSPSRVRMYLWSSWWSWEGGKAHTHTLSTQIAAGDDAENNELYTIFPAPRATPFVLLRAAESESQKLPQIYQNMLS